MLLELTLTPFQTKIRVVGWVLWVVSCCNMLKGLKYQLLLISFIVILTCLFDGNFVTNNVIVNIISY